MLENDETHKKALEDLKHILYDLENDRWFYEGDISCEYTPFEESLKSYCDSYCDFYLDNGEGKLFFDSLAEISEAIVRSDADEYYEDFFRPAELITYYLGKLCSCDDGLKGEIRDWISDFCMEYEGDMVADEYFGPFIDGEGIYHADSYYTGYDDFNRRVMVFERK